MSVFDKIKHAFEPVGHAVENFDPHHAAETIVHAIEQPVRSKLPGHLSLGEAAKVIEIAQPSAIDVDIFVGFGVELGVELEIEFDLGVTWENPVQVVGGIVQLVEQPPRPCMPSATASGASCPPRCASTSACRP